MKSFNGKFHDECLNEHRFYNLQEAREIIEEWRIDYNKTRPRSSLNGLTPNEFLRQQAFLASSQIAFTNL
ncbi:MAG: transposase [Endomicrobium sp.]|nr:transposase [Endomicrobium sp.]